jgi:hypothetical protein
MLALGFGFSDIDAWEASLVSDTDGMGLIRDEGEGEGCILRPGKSSPLAA